MRPLIKAIAGFAFLLHSACNPEGTGTLELRARLPDDVSIAQPAAKFRMQAYDARIAIETVRVTTLKDGQVAAREEFLASAREGELLNLAAGTYDVAVEALVGSEVILRATKKNIGIEAGRSTDAGVFLLAPVHPKAPVLTASPPAITNQTSATISGTKEMFTGVALDGAEVITPDERRGFTFDVRLKEGENQFSVSERNPEGTLSAAVEATVVLDTVAPVAGSLTVVSVAAATVVLAVSADGADEMMLSARQDFAGGAWARHEATASFPISPTAALVTIYAKFRDKAGNASDVVSTTFAPDTTPPESPSIAVQGSPTAVSSTSVTLALAATGGPVDMQVSEDPVFAGAAWEPFVPSRGFTLSAFGGTKTIYAHFRDARANVSVTASTSLLLDQTAPSRPGTPVFSANPVSGAVTISWSASTDALSGMKEYDLHESNDGGLTYMALVTTTAPFYLHTPLDGSYSYRVRAVDQVGNRSSFITSPALTVDSTAPDAPSVAVQGSPTSVSTSTVTVILAAGGAPAEMQVSEDPAFGATAWQAVTASLPFTLSPGDGVKTIYARFRDSVGNTSTTASDSVDLVTLRLALASQQTAVAGDTLTLSGWGFGGVQGAGAVNLGGVALTTVVLWSDSQVVFAVPPTVPAGVLNLSVYDGARYSNAVTLAVFPTLAALSVTSATGGAGVILSGANLVGQSGGSIKIGGFVFPATSPSTTAQAFSLPAAAPPGAQTVSVEVEGLPSNGLPLRVVPTIFSLSAALAVAGETVVVSGTNLGASGSLSVGLSSPLADAWSPTSVTFTVAPDMPAGLQSVAVSGNGETSNALPLTIAPSLTTASLLSASGGDVITLYGANFGDLQGASSVFVDAVSAATASWAYNQIVIVFPDNVAAGGRNAWVTVEGLATSALTFTVFPTIVSTSVAAASGNDVVTIFGTNFGLAVGSVEFDGISAVVGAWGHTAIEASVPATARPGARAVTVSVDFIPSNGVNLTIVPRIDYISPGPGASGGQTLNILGVNLGPSAGLGSVTVGGAAATVASWADTSISATMPANVTAGANTVTVTWDASSAGYGYGVYPSVGVIAPDPAGQGESLVVGGTNLGDTPGASSVVVGGMVATVLAWSMTSVTVTAPNLPDGAYDLAVTVGGFTSSPQFLTVATPISAPTDLAVTSWSATSINLSWTDNASNETGFYVKRQVNRTGGYFIVANLPADTTSYNDVSILANRTYEYVIEARNTYRFSPFSNTATADTYLAVHLAVGMNHGCAVTGDGKARCWGVNWSGQLGDGTFTHASRPVDVQGLAGPVSTVVAGDSHSCARLQSGAVQCWGANWYGQLGDGTYTDSVTPVTVLGVTAATDLTSGLDSVCVIDGPQTKCWGANWTGQLGIGSTDPDVPAPAVVPTLAGALDIEAAGNHACAVTAGTGVMCWGDGTNGQNGNSYGNTTSEPVLVAGLAIGAAKVGVGYYNGCVILSGGSLKCWGAGWSGQIGDGGYSDQLMPMQVSGLTSGVTAVNPGFETTCAVAAGAVKCWGGNTFATVGDGTTTDRTLPTQVSGLLTGFTQVAGSYYNHCALNGNGGIQCWGLNENGEVGDGKPTTQLAPVDVFGMAAGVSAFALGREHTCALTLLGGVKCWGANWYGQLGDGTTTRQLAPVDASGLTAGVVALSGNYDHYCVLTAVGGVKCWGYNLQGQLGNNSTLNQSLPVDASGLTSGVVDIQVGTMFSCAVTAGNGVKCWGSNANGQLADGTTTRSLVPVDVAGVQSGVSTLAVGNSHACALASGGLKCWGHNLYGQIGVGSTVDQKYAVQVSGMTSGVVMVAAGGYHTCAVLSDDSLWCWGNNNDGQLGDGTRTTRRQALQIVGAPAGIVALEMGNDNTCAITALGEVWCWGRNYYGQLRDDPNGASDFSLPTRIGALGGTTALAQGLDHACANAAGVAQCWGYNFYGQLGNGYDSWIPRTNIGFVP